MFALLRFSTALVVLVSLVGQAPGQVRVWQDPSGQFQVEGSLVTADDTLVIIKRPTGELVVLQREQLSPEDQEHLAAVAEAAVDPDAAPASPDATKPDTTSPAVVPVDPDRPADAPPTLDEQATSTSTWRLRTGHSIAGQLIGFGRQDFTLLRREGQLWINGINVKSVPKAYGWVVPAVASAVDNQPLDNWQAVERHIAAGGGGPVKYLVEGVQLELSDEDGVITIPLALLEADLAALVEPGFARWQAAQAEGVSEEDRYAIGRRERLFLDTYERLRRTEAAQARQLKWIELGLLGVNAGLTQLWEVALVPATPYGYPRSVVVPGRDSMDAQQIAAQAYPGWVVGTARRLSSVR